LWHFRSCCQRSNGRTKPIWIGAIKREAQNANGNAAADATVLMQITSGEIGNGLSKAPEKLLMQIFDLYNYNCGPCPNGVGCDHASQALPPYDTSLNLYNSYSGYYAWLKTNQKYSSQYSDFNELALHMVDGRCYIIRTHPRWNAPRGSQCLTRVLHQSSWRRRLIKII